MNGLAEGNALHRHHRCFSQEAPCDVALGVRLEGNEIAAQLITIEERTHGEEARVTEPGVHNEPPAVGGADPNVPCETDGFLKGRVRAAVELVFAGDPTRLFCRVGRESDRRWRGWVVMIEELGEKWAEAELTARGGIVRDEDAELLVGNEREIGVEPPRVAAVADDAQPVTRLLVEA